MTQAHKTPGNLVEFHDKVFDENKPWYPYYEDYKGHQIEVLDVPHPGHVKIRCVTGLKSEKDPEKSLEICIHDDEIKTVPNKKVLNRKM
jgi:hypothetical protein